MRMPCWFFQIECRLQTNGHGSREDSHSPPVFYSHNGTPEHHLVDGLPPTHTQSHPTGINHDSSSSSQRALHLHAMGNSHDAIVHKGSHGNITITGPSGEGMHSSLTIPPYLTQFFIPSLSYH